MGDVSRSGRYDELLDDMSERGGYPKGLTGTPWARWWDRGLWATPSCCCFHGVPCRHRQVGSDEQDLGRKTRGGRCPRGGIEGVSPLNGEGAWAPGSVPPNRFQRFCTKPLQFRPFSIRLGPIKKTRRDGSVPKVSAESE